MTARTGKIGLVTVTYNSAAVLEDFLDSVAAQTAPDLTLYAVDNNSHDSTVDVLESYAPRASLEIIRNDGNRGVAFGNNQGITAALADGCDWVLLVNNDTSFDPDTVQTLVDEAEGRDISILSPFIEAEEPAHSVWFVDAVVSPWKGFKVKHLRMAEPLPAERPDAFAVAYAPTCVLLVRSDVFRTVGLMDPIYFVYGDDVDFAIRATGAGLQYFSTGSVVVHHKASSLTGEFTAPFAARWITRNWLLVARRHLGPAAVALAFAYMTCWSVARLVVGADPWRTSVVRLRAFVEGWRVSLDAPPPRLETWGESSLTWSRTWTGE